MLLFLNKYMREACSALIKYGWEILISPNAQLEQQFLQHGQVTVLEHTIGVAILSLAIARYLKMKVDERALVRGALLHDYFLYDWHVPEPYHRLHGFRHPGFALRNASRDYCLGEIEKDIIHRHMFPVTPIPPKYKESVLVCIADKICAVIEFFYQAN